MTSTTFSSNVKNFLYQPPNSAIKAQRILVKPNLGYPTPSPVTVNLEVLKKVLDGLRKVNPHAEILLVEGVCSAFSLAEIVQKQGVTSILDHRMQIIDADTLPLKEYPNTSLNPIRFKTMLAPALLQEVDCRISVGTFKRTILKEEFLISASLKNLYGLFPRAHYHARSPNSRGQLHRPSVALILQDIYFCIGHLFEGAVVDASRILQSPDWKPDRGETKIRDLVLWGGDILSVDLEACRLNGEPTPSYLTRIREQQGSS